MIYNYENCMRILDSFNNTIIKETTPLGFTYLEKLPIRHFTLGNGNKHVVVSASQHSNEIITTTFVIHLIKYLINKNLYFDDLTIHFIPILNPEGYIINTSAIERKLNNNLSLENTVNFCFDYYKRFKIDSISKEKEFKLHQDLFRDIDHTCIDKKYQILADSVQDILSQHPKGSIIDWASNGNGIDLNSNSINKQVSPFEYNKQIPYNNIRIDIPSPIGHPGKTSSHNFAEENEINYLKKLFQNLNINLIAFFNYHSIGGIIYQRPENNNKFITTYNYLLSKFYQEYTIKNNGKYDIITNLSNKITSVNDTLRINYPGNLLIELSPMMGNPIGVFGDINNFNTTIQSNINSFIYTLNNISNIYQFSKQITNEDTNIDKIYPNIDKIYKKIKKKKY